MTYRLSRKAEEDIIGIFRQGIEIFGVAQAERYHHELQRTFELIAAHPLMARERTEISPPVRVHAHGAHIIIYLADEAGNVLIVRVRHGHEDWEND